MMEETTKLINKCNKLLKKYPSFTTSEEDGYANIKIEYDKTYHKNILWINHSEDEVITALDLENLCDTLENDITVEMKIKGRVITKEFWETFLEQLNKSDVGYMMEFKH